MFELIAAPTAALAQCEIAQSVIAKYGVTFSGFTTPLPLALTSEDLPVLGERLTSIVLPNPKGTVMDGFSHSLLISEQSRRGWIVRKGGFASPPELFGPIQLEKISYAGCRVETVAARFKPRATAAERKDAR